MKRALTFLLSTILVCAACAQGGPGARVQQGSILNAGVGYLYSPAVQKELGLSAAVSKKIQDKMAEASRSMMSPPNRASNQSSEAQRAEFAKRIQAMQKIQNECLALLTAPQKARLRQITLQQLGANALMSPEIKKELGLNDAQNKKITEIMQAGYRDLFPRPTAKPGQTVKPEDRMKQMQDLMKKQEAAKAKIEAQSAKVLTPAQQTKWKAMKGKPFKLDMMGMMRSASPTGSPRRGG